MVFAHKKLIIFGKTNTKKGIYHKMCALSIKQKPYFNAKLVFSPKGSISR